MLPSPNLDDRSFEQIVQEARKAIPGLLQEWTDENTHDPGITMLEMFSWITEMQQYYMNRIPLSNQLKFLKLLGASPQLERSAAVDVRFGGVSQPLILPRGTKLRAQDQSFETKETIRLSSAQLQRILVRTEREANDYTSTNDNAGVSFYAFGNEAKQGNRLYLAFDQEIIQGELLTFAIKLFDDDPVKAVHADDVHVQVIPSARVSWKYYGSADGQMASAWLPLEVESDQTLHMTYSGKLALRFPGTMRPIMVHPANDQGRYWICCTVEEQGYECPPRIEKISINAVAAVQRDTQCEMAMFDGTGEPGQSIEHLTYLGRYGEIKVQVVDQDGRWRYWKPVESWDMCGPKEQCYVLQIDERLSAANITFGDGIRGEIPTAGHESIRVIAHVQEFRYSRYVGRSNGLPNQAFPIYELPLQSYRFRLQVGVPSIDGELLWEDWQQVNAFEHSEPSDRHYLFDPDTSEIRFGNNEHGAIPAVHHANNICLISCEYGGGTRGNVKPHLITDIVNESQRALGLSVTNPFFAEGGKERESLQECIGRVQLQLNEPFRAVTADDVQAIVTATPGLKVARVKAIPMYTVGLKDYPKDKAPGHLTVAVVPYSTAATPMPSSGFIQTVKQHLDKRRLITTEVHVIAPEYVKITVHAVVVVEPHFIDETAEVQEQLRNTVKPLNGADGSPGWSFGRTVYRGDLLGLISRVKGVSFVQELWIEAEGRHWKKSSSGDILLPPYGLIYSGEHEIEFISRTDL